MEGDENNNQRISEKLPSLECDGDKILETISNSCETAKELDIKDNQEDLEKEPQTSDVMEGEFDAPIDALEPVISNPKMELQGKSKLGMMVLREELTEEQDDTPENKNESLKVDSPPHNDKGMFDKCIVCLLYTSPSPRD